LHILTEYSQQHPSGLYLPGSNCRDGI